MVSRVVDGVCGWWMSHATHLGEPLAVLERAVDPDVLVRRERDLLRDLLHKAGLAVAVRAFTGGAGEGVATECEGEGEP